MVPLLIGTVAVFQPVNDAEGEFVLSAMLIPAVSPNMIGARSRSSSLVSAVCHCCLIEKCSTLLWMVLSWLRAVVACETRLA